MAAVATPMRTTGRGHSGESALAQSTPAVNSSESPGRKKPKKRPDSAKTIRNRPIVPKASINSSGCNRSTGDRVGRPGRPA
jgi:hypothetical protein